jgi:hypothetical protein
MKAMMASRVAVAAVAVCLRVAAPSEVQGQGLVGHFFHQDEEECYEISTVKDLAQLIDRLDQELFHHGQIAVKSPNVWGQNRMTQYRAEFEDQLKPEKDNFQLILSAYQRRSDVAALTSSTTIAAAIQPRPRRGPENQTVTSTTVAMPTPTGATVDPAGNLIGEPSPLLDASSLATLAGLQLANSTTDGKGIGIEPTIYLDQKARYLNHLHQLRRANAGDDATDMPGYGLYLMSMPISLLPSAQSQKGKGANVTLEAKLEPTPDLLPVTFRNVVILDAAYQLQEILTRAALHQTVDLSKAVTRVGTVAPSRSLSQVQITPPTQPMARSFSGPPQIGVGPSQTVISSTELFDVFGANNLQKLVEEIERDQADWFPHDPSVLTWLFTQLTTAHDFITHEARRGVVEFQPDQIQRLGEFVLQRQHAEVAKERNRILIHLIGARDPEAAATFQNLNEATPEKLEWEPSFHESLRAIDVLTVALMIQQYYVDRQIKLDMEVVARRRNCACGNPWGLILFEPDPSEEARAAFADYVACKWPIHVYSLDPAVDQQNEMDLFSQRSELQLALAVAVATGQVSFNNATSYARRLETDLATVALNRTAVGFGAGDTTFGWRFFPRIQTPPTESNPRRITNLLLNNGPGPYYDLKNRRIEPGPRDCVAAIVAPNFVPQLRMTSVSNWFDLIGHGMDQMLENTEMVRMARKLQAARAALDRICDAHTYPPDQLQMLSDRLDQLEALLPMRIHRVALPFEGDLTGSEIFSSSGAGLAPRLLTWYGEPPRVGTVSSIFIVGTGFTIHELKTIAGGVDVADTDIMSRNVLRIEIPAEARPKRTAPNLKGETRLVFDVHVASPNGVSNHLLVEAEPKDAPAAAAPEESKSAYTLNARTSTLNVPYRLAKLSDGKFQAVYAPPTDTRQLQINWFAATGTAPIQVAITFNTHYKGGLISIPLSRSITLTAQGSSYVLSGADLDLVGEEYVKLLESLDFFSADNPLPSLKTDSIFVTPVPATGPGAENAVQSVEANGQLTFAPQLLSSMPANVPAPTNINALPDVPAPGEAPAPPAGEIPPPPAPGQDRPAAPTPEEPADDVPTTPPAGEGNPPREAAAPSLDVPFTAPAASPSSASAAPKAGLLRRLSDMVAQRVAAGTASSPRKDSRVARTVEKIVQRAQRPWIDW